MSENTSLKSESTRETHDDPTRTTEANSMHDESKAEIGVPATGKDELVSAPGAKKPVWQSRS